MGSENTCRQMGQMSSSSKQFLHVSAMSEAIMVRAGIHYFPLLPDLEASVSLSSQRNLTLSKISLGEEKEKKKIKTDAMLSCGFQPL